MSSVEAAGNRVRLQAIFGPSPMIDTPGGYMVAHSIFHHIARAPAAPVQWQTAGIVTAIGVAAAIAGVFAFIRRDLKSA